MEKVKEKYILEGVFTTFDNFNRGHRIYREEFYTDYYKNITRRFKIKKIWKKDTH